MTFKETLRKSRGFLITLTLILSLSFIYGCQCEGGIGTSSEKIDTNEVRKNNLANN
ncbi:MAG: hypothetical protein WD000_08370 [Thermodesulfobacteriota bacterium]